MTIEERFQRIEHVTAGLAEQAQRDREENRQIWRDTERQIEATQRQLDQLAAHIDRLTVEAAERDKAAHERDKAAHERDAALDARIEKLTPAIGAFIAGQRQG